MSRHPQNGFSLIELMVVVAIIALLAAVAYPSYQESITKTRRADGMALLTNIVNAEERYFTQNSTYTTDLTDLGYPTATNVESKDGFYKATASICTGATITTCVNVVGTGQGPQASDGTLGLDTRGTKS